MAVVTIAGLLFVRNLEAPRNTVLMVPPKLVEALESYCKLDESAPGRLEPLVKAIHCLRNEIYKLTGVET